MINEPHGRTSQRYVTRSLLRGRWVTEALTDSYATAYRQAIRSNEGDFGERMHVRIYEYRPDSMVSAMVFEREPA